ncbi:MAG: toll/interleukin-1 receptor domain-containing protein [Anaerolineae bacterium]|nr:toll/interleukin-1 receptor domain-containing protein [Anaerolineae bacterium]
MSHVFISYSRSDSEFVEQLYSDLRANDIDVWTDKYDIEPGDSWEKSIESAVRDASAVIAVLSPAGSSSLYVRQELAFAEEIEIPIFPILISGDFHESTPIFLLNRQYLDFRAGYEKGFSYLLGALRSSWQAKSIVPPPEETVFDRANTVPEPANKGYAFLSYIRTDTDFVQQLKGFLKERGYAYWDYRESERDYNMELYRELEAQIEGAAVFLSILSDSWRETLWTAREYVYAEEANVPVFVLQAKSLERPVPILLNLRTRIDMSEGFDAGIAILGDELDKRGL